MAILGEEDSSQQMMREASTPLIEAEQVQVVEVTAPLSLPEGYGLDVSTTGPDGNVVNSSVVVPAGGVQEGERFTANLSIPSPLSAGGGASGGAHGQYYMDVPNDRWRDEIFSCLKHGILHPVICLGLFCFPVPLGQVMTRMDLNWLGEYRDPDDPNRPGGVRVSAFKVVMLILSIYLLGLYGMKKNLLEEIMELELPVPMFTFLPLNMSWWDFLFWVYCFILVMKTRSYIRRRYSIPEQWGCTGFEDCFCAFFCLPLTICQMARHTADYDTYRATYCTETGLPPNAPQIV